MTRQNRVFPDGTLAAHPARGLFMGNRGCLHDAAGRIVRPWQVRRWITCRTEFRGRRRVLMTPGHYTELFFLDEAVAAAAGHRPCAECRREAFRAFRAAWAAAHGPAAGVTPGAGTGAAPPVPRHGAPRAAEIDGLLHAARLAGPHRAALAGLPEGAFILWRQAPHLVRAAGLHPWAPGGYGPPLPRPAAGTATVLTPAPLVAAMRAGWRVVLHPSAGAAASPDGSE